MADTGAVVHTLAVPEGLEVEIYRRAATPLIGRRVRRALADERVAGRAVVDALMGVEVLGVERIGKLLLLDTDGPTVGIHFGMTGRIIVDGVAPIEQLEYGGRRHDPAWERFVLELDDGGSLRIADPRRWARVELDPDPTRLGPDVLTIAAVQLAAVCQGRRRALKAVLLDQALISGLGNLCVDEVLFWAALHPGRPAGGLTSVELEALHAAMHARLPVMLAEGGSHRGMVSPEVRAVMPACPLDGTPLERATIAGRTTVWCPHHQR